MELQLDIRGTIGTATGKVVYQKTAAGMGNISNGGRWDRQKRAHVIPIDPQTPAQLARRARMRAANLAWQALPQQERENAEKRARARNITGYNQFISEYLSPTGPALGTEWDAGATVWDNGSTIWDQV